MLKFIDLSYHRHRGINDIVSLLQNIGLSLVYLRKLRKHVDAEVIQHGLPSQLQLVDGISVRTYPGNGGFFHIPANAHTYIRSLQPDIVLVQGLIFPFQVILLRAVLGRKAIVLAQHHGERPFVNGFKRMFQKWADRCIDGYLFTSVGNARQWIDSRVIPGPDKCYEVLECSTLLVRQDKQQSRERLNMSGNDNLLWVGRLNAGKDPLTVLDAFSRFLATNPDARLYMIYQTEELRDAIKAKLDANDVLRNAVTLVGRVPHEELATWYSAADYYISGSHHEGSGYALIEAMACGCIPVVTNIAPFRAITGNGRYAIHFEVGSVDSLVGALQSLRSIDAAAFSHEVEWYFKHNLGFDKIADDIYNISLHLLSRKQ